MNWEHLQTMLWLRWRIRLNQLRKGGVANTVLLVLLAIGLSALAIGLFVTFLLLGLFAFPHLPQEVALWIWDGMVMIFLFSWMIGLLAELQRAEALSLDKFLHLPVSLTGAFLINYLSSLFSLTLMLFLPPILGLIVALVFTKGPMTLLALPLLAAFVLMVTAITYQFQGWLASLMVNKRRRRTVIVVVTAGVILVCQLPNLVNLFQPWKNDAVDAAGARMHAQEAELSTARSAGQITGEQYQEQHKALYDAYFKEVAAAKQQAWQTATNTTRLINMVLPPGWLPLGAADAAEGSALPALLGTLGMTVIGAASLWRSYRTTVRLYTGQFSAGKALPASEPAAPAKERRPAANLVEKVLPWVDEQTAAVTLGSLRSLLRAPEAKMLALAPIILAVVFGGMLITRQVEVPVTLRPLAAFAALMLVLVCTIQILGNQFGFDRSGFRVFVLSPAPRTSILLGKNLAFAPLALGMGLALVLLVQIVSPLRFADFLAVFPQAISMYLIYCLLANLLSIWTPMRIAAGTLKPTNPQVVAILIQLVFFFFVPLALALTLVPLGVQLLLEALGWIDGLPVALVLALLECAAIVFLYRAALTLEGRLLEAREQNILERVATKE